MSKGLYERRRRTLPGLNDIGVEAGKTIVFTDSKGSLSFVGASSNRVVLGPENELSSATVAVYAPGNISAISLPTLDPSGVGAEAYEAAFVINEGVTVSGSVTFKMFVSMDETVNASTEWAGTAGKLLNDIVKPTAAASTGLYYICSVAGTTAGVEPTWPTTAGGTVVDGTATWTAFAPLVNFGIQMLGKTDSEIWEQVAFAAAVNPSADIEIVTPSSDYTADGYPLNEIEFAVDISTFDLAAGDVAFLKIVRAATTTATQELDTDIAIHKIFIDF